MSRSNSDGGLVTTAPVAQARVIVRMLLDPRLQARVERDPEAFARRFGFCPCGRELMQAGLELRSGLPDNRQFTTALKLVAVGTSILLSRSHPL